MKEWVVLIACGLIGWGVVSWLISVIRPPRQPSAKDAEQAPLRLVRETRSDGQTALPVSAAASDRGTGAAIASDTGTSGATDGDAGTSARTPTASDGGTSIRTVTASDAGTSTPIATGSDPGADTSPDTSIAMETAWPLILRVDKSATAAEIEKAYHVLLAECDRVRFSTWYSAQERQEADARRAKVCAAYEFIRPRR